MFWWALRVKMPRTRRVGISALKLILLAIVGHTNDAGLMWASRRTLAEELDMDQRRVGHGMQALADAGLIATDGHHGSVRTWRVCSAGPAMATHAWPAGSP